MAKVISSGLLMFKIENSKLHYFLGRAGGPFYKNTTRSWSIPKGHVDEGEDLLETAIREFSEETSIPIINKTFIKLPVVYTKNVNKDVHIFAFRQSYDINNKPIVSNLIEIEYPKKSGEFIKVPEMVEGKYFTFEEAKDIIFYYQIPLLEHMERLFKNKELNLD